jgi:copper(I)-binding protein
VQRDFTLGTFSDIAGSHGPSSKILNRLELLEHRQRVLGRIAAFRRWFGSSRSTALFGGLSVPAFRSRNSRIERFFFGGVLLAATCLGLRPNSASGSEAVQVFEAWVPAASRVGIDVPLLMTIKNGSDDADSLLRVRCPIANFAEKHTVDRGEGSPAMRAISSIPVAPRTVVVLKPDQYHLMLVQTRQPLVAGETFNCSVVFQKAGTVETEVHIKQSP